MVFEMILNVCSIASLFACAFIPGISDFFSHVIITLSLVFLVVLVGYTISKKSTIVCRSEKSVKRTMYSILSQADGEIRIVSRRMSWLTNEILDLLEKKRENVVIYMEEPTKKSEKLQNRSINVKFYGHNQFFPNQRFTIIRYGRSNSQVAIGEGTLDSAKYKHEIFLTTNKGNDVKSRWIKAIAMDMIKLLDKVSREKKNEAKK